MNKFTKVFLLVLCLCLLICGAAMAQKCDHGYDVADYHAEIPATCTEPAYVRYEYKDGCVSHAWATEEDGSKLMALGHLLQYRYTVEPTCLEEGEGDAYCARCNKPLHKNDGVWEAAEVPDHEVVKELNHNYNHGKVTVEPTCSSYGVVTFTCQKCGVALNVTYDMVKAIADGTMPKPQFEEGGLHKGIFYADIAKVLLQDPDDRNNWAAKIEETYGPIAMVPGAHKFGARQQYHKANAATCHTNGIWHRICELCGIQVDASWCAKGEANINGAVNTHDYPVPYEPATGHDLVTKVVWDEDETCWTAGHPTKSQVVTITYCQKCVTIKDIVAQRDGAHTVKMFDADKVNEGTLWVWDSTDFVTAEATAIAAGYELVKLEDKTAGNLTTKVYTFGKAVKTWDPEKKADRVTRKAEKGICLVITRSEKDYIPHTFAEKELKVVEYATCEKDGMATGNCQVCYMQNLPVTLKKLPHDYSWDMEKDDLIYDKDKDLVTTQDGDVVIKYPTCTEEGYMVCKNEPAKASHNKKLDKLGHTCWTVWQDTEMCGDKTHAHVDKQTNGPTCLLAADYYNWCYFCHIYLTADGKLTYNKETKKTDGSVVVYNHVAATGHNWSKWTDVNGADETTLGYKDRTCLNKNIKVLVKEARFSKGSVVFKTAPDVKNEDKENWECGWLDNFVWVSKPTCEKPGVAFHYYYTQNKKVFLDADTDYQLKTVKAFLKSINEEETFAWKNPEKVEEAVIDHEPDEGKITTPATKEAPGVMTFSCKVCGKVLSTVAVEYVPTEPVYELADVTFVDGALEGKVVLTAGDPVAKLYARVTFFFNDESTVITETVVEDGEFDAYANGDVTAVAYVLTDAAGSPVKVPGNFTDLAHGGISAK